MAQNTTSVGASSSPPNLTTGTSTPIRIGSYHGPHSMGAVTINQSTSATGGGGSTNENTPAVGGGGGGAASSSPQQSSSVPTGGGGGHLHQQQATAPLNLGSSNQSLGGGLTPPNSAGLRQSSGIANWATSQDSRDKYDGNQIDKTAAGAEASKLNRKESYKAQRKNYRREKKRVASELMNSLQDPGVIVLADWLKVRGTLKSWTKLWCVLKPGLLLIYKSHKTKSNHWVGTVLLTSCQVIERPSKKDGFCFKLFHPMDQSIWAPRGPDRETIGAVVQPLPTSYLIFRAPSQAAGKCWMDALELSLRCSARLLRSNSNSEAMLQAGIAADAAQISHETQWSEADYEKHFNDHGLHPSIAALRGPMRRWSKQHLTLPHVEITKCSGSSQSDNSRSTTPILQHFYTSITNWERSVVHAREFQKIKKLQQFYKSTKKHHRTDSHGGDDATDAIVSTGELSDASSADLSPLAKSSLNLTATPHESLKLKKNKHRAVKCTKSISLGGADTSQDEETTSSSDIVNDVLHKHFHSFRGASVAERAIHFKDLDADSQNEGATAIMSGLDTDSDSDEGIVGPGMIDDPPETPYVSAVEEEFSEQTGEQVEELADENKSLIWMLVKQVRPGMDLSKVVLPTFILEPRSFLDKLSDSYYHADILASAVVEDDPFTRMKNVVKWYLSGFYKKPQGLKKPYNPILGETFRCYWEHPNGSRTYYIAEQVSHHPPISAFYVTNRQDGFCISCSILAKSKFYGNSTSAVLEGVATLTLLPRGESYTLTTPYAHCKGILVGTLSMELGGKINIECENTGYKTELEFKLKPFLGGSESTNQVSGKIKLGKETLASIAGHWDTEMRIKDVKTGEESILFTVNTELKTKRLTRFVVPIESQSATESERLWQLVSAAIRRDDQVGATEEKTVLEEAQRTAARDRKATFTEWTPINFQQDMLSGQWIYKYADLRPWDLRSDVKQYEFDYKVLTKTRHQAPMVRTASIVSGDRLHALKSKRKTQSQTPKHEPVISDSSISNDEIIKKPISNKSIQKLVVAIDQVNRALDDHTRQLHQIQSKLERIQYAPLKLSTSTTMSPYASATAMLAPETFGTKLVLYGLIGLFVCLYIRWLLK